MSTSYKQVINDGLWHNNPGIVQLLGLCPLLAVSGTFINALGLGVATILVLIGSNVAVSMIRHSVRDELRIPIFVMIIAAFVTVIELSMNAFWHELYNVLGIFIPLIVTNCIIIARAESFAAKNNVGASLVDGAAQGIGFTLVLLTVGSMREIIGQGTLFSQAHLMFGPSFANSTLVIIDDYRGLLLAVLPPGAFLCMGLIIALKKFIDSRFAAKTATLNLSAKTQST
ncbi:MAG: electron transport complex subunit E [Gammaproteobacteria bacterium]|nr:electron transport complex subunit E [Gammaproteobacteria bacterium]